MSQHPDARLAPRGRALLCERVGGLAARKWLVRARRGEPKTDRGCRPRRLARLTPPEAAAGTTRAGSRDGRARPHLRYERERPWELVHVDVKKVPRIPEGGGHGALGCGCGSRSGAWTSCLHVAVDDNSRGAYAERLPDERRGTICAFVERTLAFYEGFGVIVERVMTDNGSAYRSGEFNALLEARGISCKYMRPFSPWQNGKVERMNGTLARE